MQRVVKWWNSLEVYSQNLIIMIGFIVAVVMAAPWLIKVMIKYFNWVLS